MKPVNLNNTLIAIATQENRDYATPEDVSEALKVASKAKVMEDFIEILSNTVNFGGFEDSSLCAFIIHKHK